MGRGFVASSKPHPKNPTKTVWSVKIQSGAHKDGFAAVDLDNIPEGITVGMDVEFSRIISKGPKGGLVAYDVRLIARQQENEDTQNEETENADETR